MEEVSRLLAAALPPLLSHLWSSTIFLVAVLLLVFAVRRRITAGAICILALIGIAKFALPAVLFAPIVDRVSDAFGPAERFEQVSLPVQVLGGGLPVVTPPTPSPWLAIGVAIWACVALVLIFRYVAIRHRLVSLAMRTATPAHPREIAALARARAKLGIRRSVDIARSSLPEAPAVLRTLRPVVVLPAEGCDDLSDEELESLLRHECAHVRRYDNLTARFEGFLCALFWFHPAIWIAQRITVVERERACDEVVSGNADERNVYVTALRKFCHAAIAPRLPGVSCMATARLRERIDYVMNYETLKESAPSSRNVAVLASLFMVLFTGASALSSHPAFAATTDEERRPYAIRIDATRTSGEVSISGRVSENATQRVIAAPALTFPSGNSATAKTSSDGLDVIVEARSEGSRVAIDVMIERGGELLQREVFSVLPTEGEPVAAYTGAPLTLHLTDADIRDVLETFGQLTGMEMSIDEDVRGKVSVNWTNVPWDEAFDLLLKENGLAYRIEGSTVQVSRK